MADADAEQHEARRSSIEKAPLVPDDGDGDGDDDDARPQLSAFEQLPDEIIQQILQLTDPNTFASLVLLNSKWRRASQQAHLYALQLAQCPSYAASHKNDAVKRDRGLPELRRLFAREVKRNLFEAYLRPSKTLIKIISNSISSSSAPGGEGIQYSPSPKGHYLLAYNSSRIYVIDLRGPDIEVKRELKILRRPTATCIKDDGSLLAVLLTEMQVDLYDLSVAPPKRTQSIILDHPPRAIAMSPCGSVLAAAYDGGIEVSSVNPAAVSSDKRSVKCDAVDALAFSFDGTQILGTTVHAAQPTTVILTAPYYDPGSAMTDDNVTTMWTTSILFPNTSRDCSHAVLLQDSSQEEASWTFAYDRSFETFRAVRIDDLRNGTTYFTGPVPTAASQARLLPCTLPSASYRGDLVSAGFQGREVWLYGVPEDLDAVPDPVAAPASDAGSSAGGLGRRNSALSTRSPPRTQENCDTRVPQWQLLCDKFRNTFIAGSKITELDGVNTVKWVAEFGGSSSRERLVIAARGILPPKPITEDDGIDFVDGGRVVLVDFDYGLEDGQTTEITIEVGTKEPEVLEEEHRDIDTEVAIVRRRTVAQKRGGRGAALRAATTAERPPPLPRPSRQGDDDADDPLVPRRVGVPPVPVPRPGQEQQPPPPPLPPLPPSASAAAAALPEEDGDSESILEEQEALDAPYSHASPRSGTTLRRAATAAAITRRLHPSAAAGRVEYRRADGRAEHPHESDADNWVPPPPPYQKEDPVDLPAFLRHAAVTVTGLVAPPPPAVPPPTAGDDGPSSSHQHQQEQQQQQQQQEQKQQQQQQQQDPSQPAQPPRAGTPVDRQQPAPQASPPQGTPSRQDLPSDVSPSTSRLPDSARPVSRDTSAAPYEDEDGDNRYDVSPPDSPRRQEPARPRTAARDTGGGGGHLADEPSPVTPSSAPVPPRPLASAAAEATPPSRRASSRLPVLGLQIPASPGLNQPGPPSGGTNQSPAVRRLSNAQTWPAAPPGGLAPGPVAAAAAAPSGYPYSAPPVVAAAAAASGGVLHGSDMMAQARPPAPRPDQLQSLSGHEGHRPPSRRMSGAFQPHQAQRAPAGRRDSRPVSGQLRHDLYLTQAAASSLPQLQQQADLYYPPPQPPYAQQHQQQQHQQRAASHPAGDRAAVSTPLEEDRPLIISTPEGVSGAYDPPKRGAPGRPPKGGQEREEEDEEDEAPPLIAPVPRHPRATAGIVDADGAGGGVRGLPHQQPQHQQQHQQQQAQPPAPPVPPPPPSSSSASALPAFMRRTSLTRRQSRAERSAAKNMADAKRRGWTGRTKSRRGRKGKADGAGGRGQPAGQGGGGAGAASSAAWTDVTWASAGQGGGRGGARQAGGPSGPPYGPGEKRDKKCVVM